jgi:hypothetical protein
MNEYQFLQLKCLVENKELPEEPTIEEGLILLKIGNNEDDDENMSQKYVKYL